MSRKVRVLVVDDSVVFRRQIQLALEKSDGIEVVGAATNGKIAIQKLGQLSVDLITLDMEMPEMDGISTIRAIRAQGLKTRIIIFSSQTTQGSEAALKALSLGADDFLAKPNLTGGSVESAADKIAHDLIPKVLQFEGTGRDAEVKSTSTHLTPPTSILKSNKKPNTYQKHDLRRFRPTVIVIGSSTGGPQALEKVLTMIPSPTRCPILITQHMPPIFTASLAKRLGESSGIACAEGRDGEIIQPNRIYVAPGDNHMKLKKTDKGVSIELDKGPLRNSVRPAVDFLFESAAKIFQSNCFGVILTGMGEDGLQGCKAIKESGGSIVIQDRASSIVFGMPGAVFNEGCYDDIKEPEQICNLLKQMAAPLGSSV